MRGVDMNPANLDTVRSQARDSKTLPALELNAEDDSEEEYESDEEPEKDEAEEELEHLVFGDSAGFRDHLRHFSHKGAKDSEEDQDATGLEGLDDADVG